MLLVLIRKIRLHIKALSAAIIVSGLAGIYFLLAASAATFSTPSEAETGVLTGPASVVSDPVASAGGSVRFGAAQADTQWLTRLPGTNYTGAGITWRTHTEGVAGSTYVLEQDRDLDNHFRMTVGQNGPPASNSQNVQRAELEPATGYGFERGKVYWMGYSFKITGNPPDGIVDPANYQWCNIMQVHQLPDAGEYQGPQPYGLYWNGTGALVAVRRYDPNATSTSTSHQSVEATVTPALTTGVWHHVEARLVFDNGAAGTGAMTIWLDGQKKVEQLNVPFGYNDTNNNYPKMGIYRAASTGIMTAEFRDVSIGQTDLSDRTGKPAI